MGQVMYEPKGGTGFANHHLLKNNKKVGIKFPIEWKGKKKE